jgi:hypothetical protein
MRVNYEHHSTPAEVGSKIDAALTHALAPSSPIARYIRDVKYEWAGDKVDFSLRMIGSAIRGSAEITDTEVIIDVGLPLMLRPFEEKAKSRILRLLGETVG